MNNCCFTGTLGRDWDTIFSKDGKQISKNGLAIRGYNNSTTWINLVIFGKPAETLAAHTQKGSSISVCCEYQPNEHEGKIYPQFRVEKFTFVGKSQNRQRENNLPPGSDDDD